MTRHRIHVNLTLIVVCAALLLGCAAPLTSATSGKAPVTLTHVTVVDADTLRATVGGARERIRIVGIDAPEVAHDPSPAECWSTQAGVALAELLKGQSVLAFPVDDVDDRDRYDRLLRQGKVAGQDVVEYLLEQGHATSFQALENHQLSRYYLDIERTAEHRRRGLWGACDTTRGPRGLIKQGNRAMTAHENSASLSRFDIEFGDCDESLHPHCEGVVCDTVLLVSGFETVEHAQEYARHLLYERYTVADVLSGPGEGLTASTMMTAERDPATVIIRDYHVADNACPSGDRSYTFVAGGHDEFSLEDMDPDPAPEELATVMPGLQPEEDHVKLRWQRECDARHVDVATSSVTRAAGR